MTDFTYTQPYPRVFEKRQNLLDSQSFDKIGFKTLVLDLDETLIHRQNFIDLSAEIKITLEDESRLPQFISVRPGAPEFL